MKKLFTLTILFFFVLGADAQMSSYGDIDTSDLKLTAYSFEKYANALVLFDKTDINTGFASTTILWHKRIKILNDKGKDEASIKLDYYSYDGFEKISDLNAETINLDNNKIQKIAVEQIILKKG